MRLVTLSDRDGIEAWLRRDAALHLYELGDLDDFFWPKTTWFGLTEAEGAKVEAIALLYAATSMDVLVAMDHEEDMPRVRALLELLVPVLPRRFYAHLLPGSADVVARTHDLEPHGTHDRMILVDRSRIRAVDTKDAVALTVSDAPALAAFYARAYPGNWFDPRMLETGAYFGIRRDGDIVSAAGVHVVSKRGRVAALGNVATDPSMRGQGLARIASAAVCKALADLDPIGLNVVNDNAAAIAMYRDLGFERRSSYEEHLAVRR